MSKEMTLAEAAKILNRHQHRTYDNWRVSNDRESHWPYLLSGNTQCIREPDALAIARDYLCQEQAAATDNPLKDDPEFRLGMEILAELQEIRKALQRIERDGVDRGPAFRVCAPDGTPIKD
jgi:hypothetical protein